MKKSVLYMLIIVCTSTLAAQSTISSNLSVRGNYFYGFIIPEYSQTTYLVDKPINAIEFSLIKKTTGKTSWERIYKYPEYGLSLYFTTLGNKDVFGNECAIYPFVKTFIIKKSWFQLGNEIGLGVGYATKKFNLNSNFQDVGVGSHVNIHFNLKLDSRFVITNKLSLNTGLSFAHFSNANMAEPNLGLNMLCAYAGINYLIASPPMPENKEEEKHQPVHELAFVCSPGGKHARALQSKIYYTTSISAEYKFHWKKKLHIGAGVDLFYDSSTKTEMGVNNLNKYKPIYDYKSGIHLSQELVYNRFSFILQEGIYAILTDHSQNGSLEYNRAIFRYKFSKHFFAQISMKSHLHILDYPEVGIGIYTLNKK